ncbi:MAG: chemotaxis response regulator protein-glutamate methylesterase [Xanthobacteraceae bacterium]
MSAIMNPGAAGKTAAQSIRVMIVDDAVVVRGVLGRWIEAEPDMQIVASLRNGREAVDHVERVRPDVVVLDIDMPELDGLHALPLLLARKRDLVVIMASTLTRRNAEISLRALTLGAKDYIAKPNAYGDFAGADEFHRQLIEKIRQLSARFHRRVPAVGAAPPPKPPAVWPAKPAETAAARIETPPLAPHHPDDIVLRAFPACVPKVLVIGASTGGPQALMSVIGKLNGVFDRVPILITQHMPPTFTAIIAEHLTQATGRKAREGRDGEPVTGGHVYVAPGGKHMRVVHRDGGPVIEINDQPPVNFCKPAVDPLFESAARVWPQGVCALVLTGMGSDGLRGGRAIVAAGGSVVAQDEATSVVWGMPGQVAHAGICSAVLPVHEIAPRLNRLFSGEGA